MDYRTFDLSRSSGRITSQGVFRLDRSTDGNRVIWYHPDWRFRQAMVYSRAADLAQSRGEPFSLPEWEGDEFVISLFLYLSYGKTSSPRLTELMHLCMQAIEGNDFHGISSRMKAMTAAGLDALGISEELGIDPDVVEVHQRCFFDIASILGSPERMSTILSPFNPQAMKRSSPSELRESLWIMAAWAGGMDLYRSFSRFSVESTPEAHERIQKVIHGIFSSKTLEFAIGSRIDGVPKMADFERYIEVSDMASRGTMAKAAIEGANAANSAGARSASWQAFVDAVGGPGRSGWGRNKDGEDLVTNLSISELRSREVLEDGAKEASDGAKASRIVDAETGVGVMEF